MKNVVRFLSIIFVIITLDIGLIALFHNDMSEKKIYFFWMFISMAFSLAFTGLYQYITKKNHRAGIVLIFSSIFVIVFMLFKR